MSVDKLLRVQDSPSCPKGFAAANQDLQRATKERRFKTAAALPKRRSLIEVAAQLAADDSKSPYE